MPPKSPRKTSAREVARKKQYNLAEKSAYQAFVALHGPVKGGQKGFRALLKERGWKVPHHFRRIPPTFGEAESERRFIEEGLGRFGRYTRHRYPEITDLSEEPDDAI